MDKKEVQVQKLTNLPKLVQDFQSEEEINNLVIVNMKITKKLIRKSKISTLEEIHKSLFHNIYVNAGEMKYAAMGYSKSYTAHKKEKKILNKQVNYLKNNTKSKNTFRQILILAFEHARLYGMHPFEDGNTRTHTLHLESKLSKIVNRDIRLNLGEKTTYEQYKEARTAALHINNPNLAPLINIILKSVGVKELNLKFIPAPFMVSREEIKALQDRKSYEDITPLYNWKNKKFSNKEARYTTSWFNRPNTYLILDSIEYVGTEKSKILLPNNKNRCIQIIEDLQFKELSLKEVTDTIKRLVNLFENPKKPLLCAKTKYKKIIVEDKNNKFNSCLSLIVSGIEKSDPILFNKIKDTYNYKLESKEKIKGPKL